MVEEMIEDLVNATDSTVQYSTEGDKLITKEQFISMVVPSLS